MPRVKATVSDEMYAALMSESERTGIPLAELIRQFVEAGLQARGHVLQSPKIKWGGKRNSDDKP